MATLIPTRKEWQQQPGEDFLAYMNRIDDVLNSLKSVRAGESFEGRAISFGVADGSAIYVIDSVKPLRIEHLPYGDAYRISPAHIRGLRISDIQQQASMNAFFKKAFGG